MPGLIPEHFIQDLLARTDIVALVDDRVKLKKQGRNYAACCPFHNEKTPSFTVAPDKQFYYCFGCGATGNAIGFLMEYDHLNFPEAVEQLAGLAGLDVPREEGDRQREREQRDRLQPLYELLARAEKLYRQQLKHAPEKDRAVNYLKGRGLTGEIAARFGLGYAPPGFENLAQGLSLDQQGLEHAVTTGLMIRREDTGRVYDRFRDRIMFPIRDNRGRTIGFGGRILGDGKPKYLNSPETPVFHKGRELYGLWEWRQSREKSGRLFVVEGYMDVIALHQFGITNVVATLGTATTEDHAHLLFRQVDEVVFCFDGDDAGRRAAWRALESILPALEDGKQGRFLFLPEGEDPDTLVREQGAEGLLAAVDEAPGLSTFLFRHLSEGLDLGTVDGRARLARLALPFLDKPKGEAYKALLKRELADRTRLNEEELNRLAASARPATRPEPPAARTPRAEPEPEEPVFEGFGPRPAPQRGRTRQLAEWLVVLLLQEPALLRRHPLPEHIEELDLPQLDQLVEMARVIRDNPEISAAGLLGTLMALELGDTLQRAVGRSLGAVPRSEQALEREWVGALRELDIQRLEAELGAEERSNTPDIQRIASLSTALHQARARRDAPLE